MSYVPPTPQQPAAPDSGYAAAPGNPGPYGAPTPPPGYGQGYAAAPPPEGDRAGYTGGLWSMIVGIASVVLSFFSLNLLPSIAALILGIINVRKPAGKTFSIVGLITGGASLLIGAAMFFIVWLPLALVVGLLGVFATAFGAAVIDAETDPYVPPVPTSSPTEEYVAPPLSFIDIETPCYEFEGPDHFVNNTSSTDIAACALNLELWGEWIEEGVVKATGVGAVHGAIVVEPLAPTGIVADLSTPDVAGLTEYLETSDFITGNGSTITSIDDTLMLDDAPAALIEVDSSADSTVGRWVIAAQAPQNYLINGEQVELFLITITSAEFSADQVKNELINSWDWADIDR